MKKKTRTTLAQTRRDVPQVLGLIRGSTKRQDMERQHEDLDWLEDRYGIQVYKRLIIEGLSGKDTRNDPDVQRILDELTGPIAEGLAISAIDRLTRPGEEDFTAYSIFQPLATAHKPIFSKREGHVEPWTPEGHEICVDAAKKARAERLELRRRSMGEKLVLAKRGIMCAASAPYGYRFRKLVKRKGAWVIHEEEAKVVQEIFRLAAVLGWSGRRIAKHLNELGISSPKGGLWVPAVVRSIMKNPAYIGRARHATGKPHECGIPVPAILDTPEQRAWWDAAQVNRAKNQTARAGRPSPNYLFQKLIFCPCDKRMTGRRRGRNRRAYVPHPDGCTCGAHEIQCEKLDNNAYTDITRRLSDVDTIRGLLHDYREHQKAARPVGPSRAERLAKLQRELARAKSILTDSELPDMWDDAKKRKLAAQAEIATLEREEEREAEVFQMPSEPTIQSFARDVAEVGRAQDYATRRGLVDRVVKRLIWEGNGNYTVEGRIVLAQNSIKSQVQIGYRGIRTDAERQCKHHGKREAGAPAKSPYGELEILKYTPEHDNSWYPERSRSGSAQTPESIAL